MGPTDRTVGGDHREKGTAEHLPYMMGGPSHAGNGRGAPSPESHQVQRPQGAICLACSRTSKTAMWLGWSRWKVLQDKSLSHSPGKKAGSREDPDPVALKREHTNVRARATGAQEGEREWEETGLRDDQDSEVGWRYDEELLEASAEMIYIFHWMCVFLKTLQQILRALS